MSPEAAIAMLDRQMDQSGQPVTLRRTIGAAPATQVTVDAAARAFIRRYQPEELVGAQFQGQTEVVLSPSDIARARWPGAAPPGYVGDWSSPRKGDLIITADGPRQVIAVDIIRMNGVVVRYNIGAQG